VEATSGHFVQVFQDELQVSIGSLSPSSLNPVFSPALSGIGRGAGGGSWGVRSAVYADIG